MITSCLLVAGIVYFSADIALATEPSRDFDSSSFDITAPAPDMPPGALRPTPAFAGPAQGQASDRVIRSAIGEAQRDHKSQALISGLESLLNSQTEQQKRDFAFGSAAGYELPGTCSSRSHPPEEKGLVGNALRWVCRKYWETVTYLQCRTSNGEEICDEKVKEVLVTSCDWE